MTASLRTSRCATSRSSRRLDQVVGQAHDRARLRAYVRCDGVRVPIYLVQRQPAQEIGDQCGREGVAGSNRIDDPRWNRRACRLLVSRYQQRALGTAGECSQTKIVARQELSQHQSRRRAVEPAKLRNPGNLVLIQLYSRSGLQRHVDRVRIEEMLPEIHIEHP